MQAIGGYLQRSGSVGILVALETGGKRFNELKELVGVSPSTLSKRLEEGRDLGVVATQLGEDERERERGTVHHEYVITDRGLLVLHKLDEYDVVYAYQQLREAEQRLDEGVEDVQEWIMEHTDLLARAKEQHPARHASGGGPAESFESMRYSLGYPRSDSQEDDR
jgi:DNA-binding HxlR family transcriptional regulator